MPDAADQVVEWVTLRDDLAAASIDNVLVGLVYHGDATPGMLDGEPVIADAGWFFVHGAAPQRAGHVQFGDRLAETMGEAMNTATEILLA